MTKPRIRSLWEPAAVAAAKEVLRTGIAYWDAQRALETALDTEVNACTIETLMVGLGSPDSVSDADACTLLDNLSKETSK